MEMPILEGLEQHLSREKASFHMPGHKGRHAPFPAAYDVTEVCDTGDLFAGGDFIEEAEALWAQEWGMKCCQFLTGGSTQGLHAALLLARGRGEKILVDRASHRSVYNGLGLFDFTPFYLLRRQDEAVTVEMLEEAAKDEEIKTICITSPTYYGIASDIPALGRWCRERDILLIVDGAHGCHLPFLPQKPAENGRKEAGEGAGRFGDGWEREMEARGDGAWFRGAGLVVSSAHKTLSVFGQGAVLMAGVDSPFDAEELRWAASVVGTSSPSYLILASLDQARGRFSQKKGKEELRRTVERVKKFRSRFGGLDGDGMDPMRLTLTVDRKVLDGFALQSRLEAAGVYPEMADMDHLVLLFSPDNREEEYNLLWKELEKAEGAFPGVFAPVARSVTLPMPEGALRPKEALTRRRKPEKRALEDCVGEISAQQVAPYPPGIPVIAPGDKITEKTIAYLREVGYNVKKPIKLIQM